MWLVIFACVFLVFAAYYKLSNVYKYWKNRGVKYLKPVPFFGSVAPFVFKKRSFADTIQDFYRRYPDERYVGFYQFLEPTLLIRDPELLKRIMVKDFDTFGERKTFIPEGVDTLWDKNLFAMKGGEKWHDMRSTLSPSFTSSKMKLMFPLVQDCARQFVDYFLNQEGPVEIEMKDTFSKYANDVIATAAYGITCDSLKDDRNQFYLMGKKLTDFSGLRALLFFVYTISPGVMKLFKLRIIRASVGAFFRKIIKETITMREQNGIVRPDMIHLLLEAKKGRLRDENQTGVIDSGFAVVQEAAYDESKSNRKRVKPQITDEDITAQALIFFFAGFGTSSTLMSYICYELAVNPDVQAKLFREVRGTLENCKGGRVTYEDLLGMKYLDMVVSEALRKWPPAEFVDRQCMKPFTIPPESPGEQTLIIQPKINCWIPIYPIHRDPNYYPNPEKFDPERFSDENKHNIKPFTYLPFGNGPRNCIGSRFGLLESKLIIFEVLNAFEIVPVKNTQIPLRLMKGNFDMVTEKGINLGLQPRKAAL